MTRVALHCNAHPARVFSCGRLVLLGCAPSLVRVDCTGTQRARIAVEAFVCQISCNVAFGLVAVRNAVASLQSHNQGLHLSRRFDPQVVI